MNPYYLVINKTPKGMSYQVRVDGETDKNALANLIVYLRGTLEATDQIVVGVIRVEGDKP